MSVAYNKKINFTQDNFVYCEAAFVEQKSIFARHCPMSGANIQTCTVALFSQN